MEQQALLITALRAYYCTGQRYIHFFPERRHIDIHSFIRRLGGPQNHTGYKDTFI